MNLPSGRIYADTEKLEDKLEVIELADIQNKEELKEELISNFAYEDLIKYKRFIYQDMEKVIMITFKELY